MNGKSANRRAAALKGLLLEQASALQYATHHPTGREGQATVQVELQAERFFSTSTDRPVHRGMKLNYLIDDFAPDVKQAIGKDPLTIALNFYNLEDVFWRAANPPGFKGSQGKFCPKGW